MDQLELSINTIKECLFLISLTLRPVLSLLERLQCLGIFPGPLWQRKAQKPFMQTGVEVTSKATCDQLALSLLPHALSVSLLRAAKQEHPESFVRFSKESV